MWSSNFSINSETASRSYRTELESMMALLREGRSLSVQSSGSSGKPKAFNLDLEDALASADLTLNFFNLKAKQRALVALPLQAVSGALMVIRAMRAGLELHAVTPQANPFLGFEDKQDGFFDFVALTPYQVAHSMVHLRLVKTLLVGGARLSNSLLYSLPDGSQITIFESYGMTETLTHVALRKRYPIEEGLFTALSGVQFTTGEAGNLIIHASHLKHSTVITNDSVRLHSETQFEYIGRLDHSINSGGVKLFPERIEQKISRVYSDFLFFVSAMPHPELGEQAALVIEGDEALRKQVEEGLDQISWERYEKPKAVYALSNFFYTSTQKFDRLRTMEQLNLK
ncbi:MAG: AMP-binding protein [Flavobacteriaceae bacterium]